MTTFSLTFVCEPPRVSPYSDTLGPARYDPLIAAIERYAGLEVRREHGLLPDVAPEEGFILLGASSWHPELIVNEFPAKEREGIASRLVPLDASSANIFDHLLERLSLPAAIDSVSLWEWETRDPGSFGARGPHGLRDVGALIGASCLLFESARYCYLQSATHDGLPHLLVDYLRAYASRLSTSQ